VEYPPLPLREAERTLALFVTGLTDGALMIAGNAEATAGGAYTDGRTIFLPERVAHAPMRAGNLRVYKATIAHTAAQRLYGTLELDGLDRLRAADSQLIFALFDIIEGTRLAARLTSDFPGSGAIWRPWDARAWRCARRWRRSAGGPRRSKPSCAARSAVKATISAGCGSHAGIPARPRGAPTTGRGLGSIDSR
jgi:hypothetical protein